LNIIKWYVVYCSNEGWSLFNNNVLINLCYIAKSGFGCDTAYLLHHVTVTIMVTVTTSTAERMVGSEGKGKEERRKRRKEGERG
jgi:hypothetical protein